MIAHTTDLLTATDVLSNCNEYKVWIYRNYIISLLQFCLCVDVVSGWAFSKLESIANCFLKKWLNQLANYTKSQCENHLQTLTAQSKFGGSAELV